MKRVNTTMFTLFLFTLFCSLVGCMGIEASTPETTKKDPVAPADTDGDGIPDYQDLCPKLAVNAFNDLNDDGCPDPRCGNGKCEALDFEDFVSCPQDCKEPPKSKCGDGICDPVSNETTQNCPHDCPAPSTPSVCGNGKCELGENSSNCVTDCPLPTTPVCGNKKCEVGENNANCAKDCTSTSPVCGNAKCEWGENTSNCVADCGQPSTTSVCGNKKCEVGENNLNCAADCVIPATPTCGNKKCETGETTVSCPSDCTKKVVCGDGKCESGENVTTCPADCGTTTACNTAKEFTIRACYSSSLPITWRGQVSWWGKPPAPVGGWIGLRDIKPDMTGKCFIGCLTRMATNANVDGTDGPHTVAHGVPQWFGQAIPPDTITVDGNPANMGMIVYETGKGYKVF